MEIAPEEAEALESFKKRIEDTTKVGDDTSEKAKKKAALAKQYFENDAVLLRFLTSKMKPTYKFQLDVSETQFRDTIEFKVEEGVADVVAEWEACDADMLVNPNPSPITDDAKLGDKLFYGGFYGHTKLGALLMVERLGAADSSGISSDEKYIQAVRKSYIHYLETVWQFYMYKGVRSSSTMVIDLTNFSMSSLRYIYLAKAMVTLSTSYWPELTNKIYVINAGWSFQAIFAAISPFLPERTKNKVAVLGSDYKDTIAEILPGGMSQLPDFLGGGNTTHGVVGPLTAAEC